MSREDQIQDILEVGRQTRRPTPRWMWIAALVVGVVCATGFLVAMLGEHDPVRPPVSAPARPEPSRSTSRPGLGIGLVAAAGACVVVAVAVARQRRSHSSRRSP